MFICSRKSQKAGQLYPWQYICPAVAIPWINFLFMLLVHVKFLSSKVILEGLAIDNVQLI